MDLDRLAAQAQAYIDAGETPAALALYEAMLAIKPDDPDLHHILGLVHRELGRTEAAALDFQRAIDLNPRSARYHRSLADLLQDHSDYPPAIALYRKALTLAPDDTDILLNLGNALQRTGESTAALAIFERILSFRSDHCQAMNNIGKCLYDRGDYGTALKWYTKSIHTCPEYAEAQFNRAIVLLATGAYGQGWPAYEWRFRRREAQTVYPHRLPSPRWDGGAFNGERLLVHCEQGYGDVLQFCRYLPMVKALGGSIIFEAHAPLLPLFAGMDIIDELLAFDAAHPPIVRHDKHIPLLSLPLVFGTRLATIPAQVPYLYAPADTLGAWGHKFTADRLRVGLVWSGSAIDPHRDCPLGLWRPLWDLPGIHFYGLQKGPAAEQSRGPGHAITSLGEELVDFGATAAALAHLDLVICVDTAVAHLAGAMGKPVWMLLPFTPDWRWLRERSDSPWYPTARLFRQMSPGAWQPVIAAVCEALHKQSAVHLQVASAEPTNRQGPDANDAYTRGLDLCDSGDFKSAVKAFQQAITIQPHRAETHFNLGRAYHELGQLSEAIPAYRSAVRLAPEMNAAHANLALAYQQSGQLDAAAACYQHVISRHMDLATAFSNLGVIREQQLNPSEAAECYHCALRIDPTHADGLYNLGNIHLAQGDLDTATEFYRKALAQRPNHFKACANLGWTYHRMGLIEKALEFLDQAIALNPQYPEAHLNRGVTRLLVGDWQNGWLDYEWRFQCRDRHRLYPHRLYGERWDGRSFKNKTLLVHSEQGIGDAIQFARYLPLVKQRGGRVVFEARASLIALFHTLVGVDELIELSKEKPPARHYDMHIPLCSLARIFDTLPGTVPHHVPYLAPDPAKIDQWRRLLPTEGLNVGLVWGGNDTYKERSILLADLSPLAFVRGINWIGLQKGPAAAQSDSSHLPHHFTISNWGEQFHDFGDTAAAVASLDLVISIDTSVAHLAGALNKAVWVLLPVVPDWRWMLERSQTPWYPSMRLFRQTGNDGWVKVVNHLCTALEHWRKDEVRKL
jgi:tetratricopeptide (TPR) repeat protein/catechol 2,3-dioxygenase-like lactoylglutathione lyase family enzyme